VRTPSLPPGAAQPPRREQRESRCRVAIHDNPQRGNHSRHGSWTSITLSAGSAGRRRHHRARMQQPAGTRIPRGNGRPHSAQIPGPTGSCKAEPTYRGGPPSESRRALTPECPRRRGTRHDRYHRAIERSRWRSLARDVTGPTPSAWRTTRSPVHTIIHRDRTGLLAEPQGSTSSLSEDHSCARRVKPRQSVRATRLDHLHGGGELSWLSDRHDPRRPGFALPLSFLTPPDRDALTTHPSPPVHAHADCQSSNTGRPT